jgi:hypothetical protein
LLKYSDLVPYFMFAPVTSCDLKRFLSKFKDILTFKRSFFTVENLEKYILIQTYYSNMYSLKQWYASVKYKFKFTSHKNYRIIPFSTLKQQVIIICLQEQ